jgi:hypothetical protein
LHELHTQHPDPVKGPRWRCSVSYLHGDLGFRAARR